MSEEDFIILMSHNRYIDTLSGNSTFIVYSVEDRKRLYTAGIRTFHEQPAWGALEPVRGEYNFGYLDGIIQSNRDAGLKSLIMIAGWMFPDWMPSDWFTKSPNGQVWRNCMSFWNEEAQEYSDNYYTMLRDRYIDQKDIAFFFGEFQGGEAPQAPWQLYYDVCAVEDYKKVYGTDAMPDINTPETTEWFGKKVIEHCVRKMELLYEPWHEMWNAYQYLMNRWDKNYGIYVQPELLKKYHELHPEGQVVLMQYTYFDSAHGDDNAAYVDMLRDISGCDVIVEAMFCGGLAKTTPKAIGKGFRGQILHPQQSGFDNQPLTDGMLNAIRTANDLWKASR